jgi:hypothetical protein
MLVVKILVFSAISLTMIFSLPQEAVPTMSDPTPTSAMMPVSYTYVRPDGNRIIDGHGTFPNVTDVDYPSQLPTWIIGSPDAANNAWLVVSDHGEVRRMRPNGSIVVGQTAPRQPIAGVMHDGVFVPLLPETLPFEISSLTHPTVTSAGLLWVTVDGDLVLWRDNTEVTRIAAKALPDARIVMQPGSTLAAVYVDPTNRYAHGVLGDTLEGASLLILDTTDLREVGRITLAEAEVFEGIMPMWADIDADGQYELITTVSSATQGSQIRAFRLDGTVAAEGEPIGRGGRWRHQIAFGPFGPDGEDELVVVRTPHIGGVIEYYRYQDGALNIVAELSGYTSHVLYTRNLAMAVAGDFNGDGRLELTIPDQEREVIAGIQRTHESPGAEVVWRLPAGGLICTNLAVMKVTDSNGSKRLSLAVGTGDDRIRVWR